VDREYDIFESLTDGSSIWRDHASGLQDARSKLNRLVRDTGREYFAVHLPTGQVVFPVNPSKVTAERSPNRIFQVAYSEKLRFVRAELLRNMGYAVISALGNEAAKTLLTSLSTDDLGIRLFIVGHTASAETRKEMVDWIKAKYPEAKILALNPPNEKVPTADYNVRQNGPEAWLPFVAASMKPLQAS